jgi:lysophospholipase L1-like esterase
MTRIVTLGDSITLGMGDPAPGGGWRGWASHLAAGLPKPELHNLAANGAQAKHVERDQLPSALLLRPHVASVVVGINDTLRAGFDPVRSGQAIARTVAALTAGGATVVTMRLPDPAQMFGLPSGLAKPLSRRMRAVNAELDRIAAHYGTVHWDASTDPETYDRRNWSVDRLHPNERGHRLIAGRCWDLLAAAGFPVAERPGSEPTNMAPSRHEDMLWMATKGTRWVLRRSVDLIPYMLFMAAREALVEQREWPVTPLPGAGLPPGAVPLAVPPPAWPVPAGSGASLADEAQAAKPVAE